MLDKKTDFPQSQSVQNSVENLPLLFDREFILEDGQTDVRLFGDSYFVLDVGAAIGADDFRSQNPGPDKFFVTPLAKRVFVDLEEMRRTAFVKDILYFLDAPNYQQALFISKENAGDTISLKNCRGLASAISLFDWDKLMGDLGGIAKDLAKNTSNIQDLTASLKEAEKKIDVNAKGISVNAQNIIQRVIAPQNTNWFLQASEGTEGREYFLDNTTSGAVLEISSAQVFNGGIVSPFIFIGDAHIYLRSINIGDTDAQLSVELLINGVPAGTAEYTMSPDEEFSNIYFKIPAVQINARDATPDAPYAVALRVVPESGISYLAGEIIAPSVIQFQGGGLGGDDVYTIGDITTLSPSSSSEDIADVFGGPEGFANLRNALKTNTKKIVAMKTGMSGLIPIIAVLLQNEMSIQFIFTIGQVFFSMTIDETADLIVSDYTAKALWQLLNGDTNQPANDLFYSSLKTAQLLANKQDKLVERYLYLSGNNLLVRDVSQITRHIVSVAWVSGSSIPQTHNWDTAIISTVSLIPANQVIKFQVPIARSSNSNFSANLKATLSIIDGNPIVIASSTITGQLISSTNTEFIFDFLVSENIDINSGAKIRLTLEIVPTSSAGNRALDIWSGDLERLSYVQFLGGGVSAGSRLEGDIVTIDAFTQLQGFVPSTGPHKYMASINGKPWLINGVLRKQVFDTLMSPYYKGDILWLEPPTYDTQTTPPAGGSISYPHTVPGEQAFMGKARTYSAQTQFRQHAVRLRALKDNPRNPNIVGAIGSDWAVDDPGAIVEEGSNSIGYYTMYAGGDLKFLWPEGTAFGLFPGVSATLTYPIYVALVSKVSVTCSPRYVGASEYNGGWIHGVSYTYMGAGAIGRIIFEDLHATATWY